MKARNHKQIQKGNLRFSLYLAACIAVAALCSIIKSIGHIYYLHLHKRPLFRISCKSHSLSVMYRWKITFHPLLLPLKQLPYSPLLVFDISQKAVAFFFTTGRLIKLQKYFYLRLIMNFLLIKSIQSHSKKKGR